MSSIENLNFEGERKDIMAEIKLDKEKKLIKNVKFLEKIPEDTTNPNLTIKLDNLGNRLKGKYKFSLLEDEEGKKYFVAILAEKEISHGDALLAIGKFYKKNFSKLLDGGFVNVDIEKNKLSIYNFSDHSKIVEKILENKFPDINIKIDSIKNYRK